MRDPRQGRTILDDSFYFDVLSVTEAYGSSSNLSRVSIGFTEINDENYSLQRLRTVLPVCPVNRR